MDWNKIAPWNWFRKEQERDVRAVASVRAADPFIRAEMDRAFEDIFRRFGGGSLRESFWPSLKESPSLLRPSVDISEGHKAYTVRMEMPGVEKGDVALQIEDDALLVRGEKKQEKEEDDEGYHCVERSYGTFERVLSLPDNADPEGIKAKFKNGILRVTIPKRTVPEREGRTIEIHHE
jgi:HSP20 family protein